MYRRNIETSLRKALRRAGLLCWRPAGRRGRAGQSVAAERGGRYFTLDDAATLYGARRGGARARNKGSP